ncbi:hypothetical protein [Aureliella helgolandensis]|uniref:HEAT repeat protein n=1 Tax=Aureliella helgolandensis TaxID=2527968 RepID=A0A518G543_9BACT|nr:hypothetical protein [Aureliella helgolandensis]QDV23718.1 hypothetical protein Q31a_20230 [Aureliella helgolandensis]
MSGILKRVLLLSLMTLASLPSLATGQSLTPPPVGDLGASSVEAVPAIPAAGSEFAGFSGAGGAANGPPTSLMSRSLAGFQHVSAAHAQCKAKLRASPLGKLIAGLRKPLSSLTGGLVPAEATPNAAQLSKPGPQGVAAKIKKDQLEAPQRMAAIQELGKVDCHWYPEASVQLALALRADRSECVRFEAAKILSRCSCCTPQVVQALRTCVDGSDRDGNPGELSLRIRNQAAMALASCLGRTDASDAAEGQPMRPEYPILGDQVSSHSAPSFESSTEYRVVAASAVEAAAPPRTIPLIADTQSSVTTVTPQQELSLSNSEILQARRTLEQFRQSQLPNITTPEGLMGIWERAK